MTIVQLEEVVPTAVGQSAQVDAQAHGSGGTSEVREQDPKFAFLEEIDATGLGK